MSDPRPCCDRLAECHELLRGFATDRRLVGYVPACCRRLLERHGVALRVGPLPEVEPEAAALLADTLADTLSESGRTDA